MEKLNDLTENTPTIMYAHNMDMPPKVKGGPPGYLATTRTVRMCDVESYMRHLPGGRHKGIRTPTVYVGSEGATFNAHHEDQSWEGMNRQITGPPKVW